MADLIQIAPGETDLGKIVAALRAVIERFPASEDLAAGALLAANNLDDVANVATARGNLGAVAKAGDTMTGLLITSLNNSTTRLDYYQAKPTDWGVGKPYLFVVKGTPSATWEIGLWDGVNTNGIINIECGTLQHNGNTIYDTANLLGLQTIWVPAAGMVGYPGAAPGQTTYTSAGFSAITFDFDQTTLEAVNFAITMPKSWDKGSIFFVPYWTATGGTGGVVWNFFSAAISDNEALNASISTTVSSADTFQNADRLHIAPVTGGLTPDGSPANDDMLYFAMNRDPTNGSDTLTADARLIGVKVLYTVNAANDT